MKHRLYNRERVREADTLAERLEIIERDVGIPIEVIKKDVWSQKKIIRQIFSAAKLYYETLKDQGYPTHFILSHITSGSIASMVNLDHDTEDTGLDLIEVQDRVKSNIASRFRDEKKELKDKGEELTHPQLLRKHIYESIEQKPLPIHALESYSDWDGMMKFPSQDQIKGTKIPSSFDYMTNFIVSTMLANNRPDEKKHQYLITNSEKYAEYYRAVIFNELDRLFNIRLTLEDDQRKTQLDSETFYTFLDYISGGTFDFIDYEKVIDKIPDEESLQTHRTVELFAKINRQAQITPSNTDKDIMTLSKRRNHPYLFSLLEKMQSSGIDCTFNKKGLLRFSNKSLENLANDPLLTSIDFPYHHQGCFVNPYLIRKL